MTTSVRIRQATLRALLLSLVPGLLSSAARAESVAVVPVAFADSPASLDQATKLAAAFSERGYAVISQEQIVKRLMRQRWPAAIDIQAMNAELDAEARGQSDLNKSVEHLQGIVGILQKDPAPNEAKIKLMQRARLLLARSLYQLAFLTGDRERNQQIQQRIFANLEAAVRSDPFVTMPLEQFSPEVRRLLDQARARVVKAGTGRLELHCDKAEGQVFVDGRQLGHCPLYIDDSRPLGRYRVWVQRPGCRSRTHLVDVHKGLNRLDIDMGFDCSVDHNDGSLHVAENAVISDSMAIDAGRALGVDLLVITGVVPRDDGKWAFAVLYRVATAQALRRGAVRLQKPEQQQLDQLAAFLHQPESKNDQVARGDLPFAIPVEGEVQSMNAGTQKGVLPTLLTKDPLLGGAVASGAVTGLALIGAAVGLGIWAQAYANLSRPVVPRDEYEGLQGQANLGWTLAGVGGAVAALGALTGGGLLLWRQVRGDAGAATTAGNDKQTAPLPADEKMPADKGGAADAVKATSASPNSPDSDPAPQGPIPVLDLPGSKKGKTP